MAQAIQSMHRTVYAESARELTAAELEMLEESGVDLDDHAELHDPMVEYAAEFAAILKTILSTSEVAEQLGVHAVRIVHACECRRRGFDG